MSYMSQSLMADKFKLQVSEGGENVSMIFTYPVTIEPIADPVTLNTDDNVTVDGGVNMIPVVLTLTQEDTDGSETLEVRVTDLPSGVSVQGYTYNAATQTWEGTSNAGEDQLILTAPSGFNFPFSFDIMAFSRETSNLDESAPVTQTVTIEALPVVTTPGTDNIMTIA